MSFFLNRSESRSRVVKKERDESRERWREEKRKQREEEKEQQMVNICTSCAFSTFGRNTNSNATQWFMPILTEVARLWIDNCQFILNVQIGHIIQMTSLLTS